LADLQNYLKLMRLDRPWGSLLLLWPTLTALWIAAEGTPAVYLIVIFTLGTFVMRSAGCVINDYADRHVDRFVARTKDRPLATGAVSPRQALYLFSALVTCAGVLVLFLNQASFWLALIGLGVATLYPFMKRWTQLPQLVLGIAFSWGILMAYTATDTPFEQATFLMFGANVLWIVAYDTLYAMVDREDDLKIGIKSTAILFGRFDRLIIGTLQLAGLCLFSIVGWQLNYQFAYFIGISIAGALFIYQQFLIRNRSQEGCFAAFLNNIQVGFALFCGTLIEISLSNG